MHHWSWVPHSFFRVSGHWNQSKGDVLHACCFLMRHPFLSKLGITCLSKRNQRFHPFYVNTLCFVWSTTMYGVPSDWLWRWTHYKCPFHWMISAWATCRCVLKVATVPLKLTKPRHTKVSQFFFKFSLEKHEDVTLSFLTTGVGTA